MDRSEFVANWGLDPDNHITPAWAKPVRKTYGVLSIAQRHPSMFQRIAALALPLTLQPLFKDWN